MGYLMARHRALPRYVPGTHEEDAEVVRLNTNESPYPPSPGVAQAVAGEIDRLQFYNDPDCTALRRAFARVLGVQPENVLAGNGSDEVLYWAFLAFADGTHPIALPDVTYGYYDLFAAAHGIPLHRIPLRADFSVNPEDYIGLNETIVLANPNAPTGLALPPAQVERIARSNPRSVLILDEAYVDFGADTCLPLMDACPNLLITRTFSKSRSLAGARLGFGIGCPALIAELETVRNAVNLYSVSRMAQAAGVASCREDAYYRDNCARIVRARAYTTQALRARGFTVADSLGNFVFARCAFMDAGALQEKLAARGILVRHWDAPRIGDYLRITIGTQAQMEALMAAIDDIRQGE
ncbi:MAG: pyridoxal phosphate-dependent aminotransferase [Candidatus Ventricola sp.]